MSGAIREILNKHKWHHGDLESLELVVLHRGAPADRRVIAGSDLLSIGARGVSVVDELAHEGWAEVGEEEEGCFIPYHRLLAVRGPEGLLWEKPAQPSEREEEP